MGRPRYGPVPEAGAEGTPPWVCGERFRRSGGLWHGSDGGLVSVETAVVDKPPRKITATITGTRTK